MDVILRQHAFHNMHAHLGAGLDTLVAALRQAVFESKSEKADPDQFELALEDIETGIAQVEAAGDANPLVTPTQTSKPRKINRGLLPKHLLHIEEVIEPNVENFLFVFHTDPPKMKGSEMSGHPLVTSTKHHSITPPCKRHAVLRYNDDLPIFSLYFCSWA